jgi:hypothetical protein
MEITELNRDAYTGLMVLPDASATAVIASAVTSDEHDPTRRAEREATSSCFLPLLKSDSDENISYNLMFETDVGKVGSVLAVHASDILEGSDSIRGS